MVEPRSTLNKAQNPLGDTLSRTVPVPTLQLELESAYQGIGSAAGKFSTSYALGAAFRDQWDGTPARIDVIESETGRIVRSFNKLILTALSESQSERVDPVYTFGATNVFSSGRQPRVYVYQGITVLTERDGNTRNELFNFYKRYLRGSANLVGEERRENPYHARISFRNVFRDGFVVSLDTTASSDFPSIANVAISMFVYEEYNG